MKINVQLALSLLVILEITHITFARAEIATRPTPNPILSTTSENQKNCKDLCGNGICDEMVCMEVGCPCAESQSTCPADCKNNQN